MSTRLRSCLALPWWRRREAKAIYRHGRVAAAIALALSLSAATQGDACWLEPTLKGGLSVSHPGALDVAVAVAKARRAGWLPQPNPEPVSNEARFHPLLMDLRRLQSRLDRASLAPADDRAAPFSLVLVGPGLWSHYYPASQGILAVYHAGGPLVGQVVVLTHHVVLRALLSGELTMTRAAELGLIAFVGSKTLTVEKVLALGLQS